MICCFLILFLRQSRVMALQSKVVFLFSLVGACWNTLLRRVIALLCQTEILAKKYLCVYSLLQKALVLFYKLFFVVHYSYSPLNSGIPDYSEVSKLGSTAAKGSNFNLALQNLSEQTPVCIIFTKTDLKQK